MCLATGHKATLYGHEAMCPPRPACPYEGTPVQHQPASPTLDGVARKGRGHEGPTHTRPSTGIPCLCKAPDFAIVIALGAYPPSAKVDFIRIKLNQISPCGSRRIQSTDFVVSTRTQCADSSVVSGSLAARCASRTARVASDGSLRRTCRSTIRWRSTASGASNERIRHGTPQRCASAAKRARAA